MFGQNTLLGWLFVFISGGLAGSIFTFFVSRKREICTICLESWCFPNHSDHHTVQCFNRVSVLSSYQSIEWIELIPNKAIDGTLKYWGSRPGIKCEIVNNHLLKISHLRKKDFVDILFLVNSKEEISGFSDNGPIDYNSAKKIIAKKRYSILL